MIRPTLALVSLLTAQAAFATCSLVQNGSSEYHIYGRGSTPLNTMSPGAGTTIRYNKNAGLSDVLWVSDRKGLPDIDVTPGPENGIGKRSTDRTMTPTRAVLESLDVWPGDVVAFRPGSITSNGVNADHSESGTAVTNTNWAAGRELLPRQVSSQRIGQVYGSYVGLTSIPTARCSQLLPLGKDLWLYYVAPIKSVDLYHGSKHLGSNSPDLIVVTPVRLDVPVRLEVAPQSLAFGRVTVGKVATQQISVTVRAPSSSAHSLTFSYESDSRTPEILTISGHSLPYIANRTIPTGQFARSETFDARLTSPTTSTVSGRMVITVKLD